MIVSTSDGATSVLTETEADDGAQLQTLMKENPELLPVEEFGLTGPLLVVGEETTLPSGAADLVGLARGGDLVIIEFKTGPQNPDFRRASAQLLDYGSDLWGMSFEEFESSVATRFFSSGRCRDARVAGSKSLKDAASTVWDDFSEDDWDSCKEQLTQRLTSGAFRFVLGGTTLHRFGREDSRIPQRSVPGAKLLRRGNGTVHGRRRFGIRVSDGCQASGPLDPEANEGS